MTEAPMASTGRAGRWVVRSAETMSTQPTAPAWPHTRNVSQKIHPVTRLAGIFDNESSRSRFEGTGSFSVLRISRYAPALHLQFPPAPAAAKLPSARTAGGAKGPRAGTAAATRQQSGCKRRVQQLAARNSNFWSENSSCQRCCSSKRQQNEPRN